MRRTAARLSSSTRPSARPPLVTISDATFYRRHPDAPAPADANPPLFPGLTFLLPSAATPPQHWAVLSPSSAARTTLLQLLRGQHYCVPPGARSYPALALPDVAAKDPRLRNPQNAIHYVGFDAERGGLAGTSAKGQYLSARYESMREATDWSVRDYLLGNTELNADEELKQRPPPELLERIMQDLSLVGLADMPVANLSNGQTRRARIAKALLARPELLLLDGPFMGLDPYSLQHISSLLHRLAEAHEPRLILSLRPQDAIPDWITHFVLVGNEPRAHMVGSRKDVFEFLRDQYNATENMEFDYRPTYYKMKEEEPPATAPGKAQNPTKPQHDIDSETTADIIALREMARKMEVKGDFDRFLPEKKRNQDGLPFTDERETPLGDAVVEMQGVKIRYGDGAKAVLGDWHQEVPGAGKGPKRREGLWWEVRQGQRWGVFGPNGSGKTTLLSLITSDHPQTYSAPVKLFGRPRLDSGVSIFDIHARIGHSSPEVHAFFPRHLTVRRVLESAWADTPLTKPRLDYTADQKVDSCLRWFRAELNPALGETLDQRAEAFRNPSEKRESGQRYLEIVKTYLHEEDLDVESLEWAETLRFGELTFSAQRVALFLRAIVKQPDLIVLDEAFSGMDEMTRDRCLLFLNHGESMALRYVHHGKRSLGPDGPNPGRSEFTRMGRVRVPGLQDKQALVVVSHARDEVPGCVREWICLPGPDANPGTPPRFGRLDGPLSAEYRRWGEIWGIPLRSLPGSALDWTASPYGIYSATTRKTLFKDGNTK